MHPLTRLELTRCILRPLAESDAPSIARHANNRKIWINLRDVFPHPYALEDAVEFIERTGMSERSITFAIDVNGAAVGTIGLVLRDDVDRVSAELGYWLGQEFWGRGIMSEAVKAATAYGITHHQLTRVYAYTFDWNPASARVLEKSGFHLEGRLRRSAVKDGRILDQFQYAYVVPVDTRS